VANGTSLLQKSKQNKTVLFCALCGSTATRSSNLVFFLDRNKKQVNQKCEEEQAREKETRKSEQRKEQKKVEKKYYYYYRIS
jgi:thymidylate kinase